MSVDLKTALANKALNSWNLFWLISIPISLLLIATMAGTDLSSGPGVSSMIQLSVRCAIPWLYLAFAASSVHILFPGLFSRWLLRNRKIMGMCLAVAMAWQLLFILWMVGIYSDYYVEEVYVFTDVLEGVVGYAFLIAMTVTTFKFGRSRITPKQWKLLHRTGLYVIWGYAWVVYWYEIFYYDSPDAVDYIYYWTGTLAWGLRIAAWTKKQFQQSATRAVAR
jgi:sulfoxide reductase heme-binding subunit YedZ